MDEYYTYTRELVPEGRRVYALGLAVEAASENDSAVVILQAAMAFEAWLKEAEQPAAVIPKPRLIRGAL